MRLDYLIVVRLGAQPAKEAASHGAQSVRGPIIHADAPYDGLTESPLLPDYLTGYIGRGAPVAAEPRATC